MIYQTTKEEDIPPFTELMISWNGARPLKGNHLIEVRVKIEEWSPWMLYAKWGSDGQSSCHITIASLRVYQDVLEILNGNKATGFEVKGAEGCSVYVYTNCPSNKALSISCSQPICLKVEGLSQMALNHVRHKDLCSPTSTTAVIRYLLGKKELDPVGFAQKAWDSGFDIFGNWVLNVAQASVELGSGWSCWVERLNGFPEIYQKLQEEIPVIVSVRGPLKGGAAPYANGHLIVVIGYLPEGEKVICMDPRFPADDLTYVQYELSDFLEGWNRRGKIAYIFSKRARVST